MQHEAPVILKRLIEGVSDSKLQARPAPGKWSVGEILAHLAEDELATAWRYRQMIEHPGSELASFDQDLWAKLGGYASWNPKEALELFRQSLLVVQEAAHPDAYIIFGANVDDTLADQLWVTVIATRFDGRGRRADPHRAGQ